MIPLADRPSRRVRVLSPVGDLEGILRPAAGDGGGALVFHPHPLLGGTMQNRVVAAAERGFARAGLATLRINFRGVGQSAGEHDEGQGEREDVVAALDYLAGAAGDVPLVVAGYSFGCAVALPVAAADRRVVALMGIGMAFRLLTPPDLASFTGPMVFVQGERDRIGPLDQVRPWVASLPGPAELIVAPGADHDFAGDLVEPVGTAAEALGRRVVEGAG